MSQLIVINGKFLRATMTGVHRVAAELANALADLKAADDESVLGFDFALWLPREAERRADAIRLPRHVVTPLGGIPWEQLTLPARQGRAILLNLCNIGPALSRRSVTMIHDAQVHLSPQSYARSFRLWYRFVQPAFARRHLRILTVSEYSKKEIARMGLCSFGKIAVVPNGVDHILREPSDPAVVERLNLVRHTYIVALATTQAHKNIGLLLRAFSAPDLAGLSLVLIGGEGRAEFQAAGMDVPSNVLFAGRVNDGELRALMEGALCLAFPSTTEGFGLPPLEAMLVGCPAIVAPCGALPEVCGDAALYASPDDSAAWTSMIAMLRDDRLVRERLALGGRKHASRFTWERAARTFAAELRSLTGDATPKA